MKWLYGSGFPIPGFYRREGDTYFLSEARNAFRLEPYQRVDLRIVKSCEFAQWKMNLYAEVLNLFNRRNLTVHRFNKFDIRTAKATLSFIELFPILPSVGVALEF